MLDNGQKLRPRRSGFITRAYALSYARVSHAELSYVTRLIALVSVGLAFFGCIMVLSASSVRMISVGRSPFEQGERQAMYAVSGVLLMLVVGIIPVSWYRRRWVLNTGLGLAILLQAAVLLVGQEVGGNRNWLVLGPVQIQPSELAKPVIILWIALMLTRQGDVSKDSWRALFPAFFGFLPLTAAIMLGHDLGTVIVYAFIFLGLLWLAGTRGRTMGILLGVALLGALVAVITSANRIQRIFGAAGVCNGATCDQANSGKVALATGGFWGVGLGQSRQKYNYLPEAHNDYIFAIIGEELGLLGTLAVLLLYLGLIYCAAAIMVRTSDRFVRLAAGGITVWITIQALINMGMVTGLLPVIGVPLPFISFGGSSLISSMLAAGLLIAFSRQAPVYPLRKDPNRSLSPREIRRENEDWQRRLALGKVILEENRALKRAGGALGFDIRNWMGHLKDGWHSLMVWLGLTREQRQRAWQVQVQQREDALARAEEQARAQAEAHEAQTRMQRLAAIQERAQTQPSPQQHREYARAERGPEQQPTQATVQPRDTAPAERADAEAITGQLPRQRSRVSPEPSASAGITSAPRRPAQQRPAPNSKVARPASSQRGPEAGANRGAPARPNPARAQQRKPRRPGRTGNIPAGLVPLHSPKQQGRGSQQPKPSGTSGRSAGARRANPRPQQQRTGGSTRPRNPRNGQH